VKVAEGRQRQGGGLVAGWQGLVGGSGEVGSGVGEGGGGGGWRGWWGDGGGVERE